MESKQYSWKWVTDDEIVSKMACEICMIALTCDGANANVTVYDGEDDNGELVMVVKGLQNRTVDINIDHHIYCRRGIYLVMSPAVFGVFIQWKMCPSKEG